jgi:glycolate oxidase iron-sulfur subunit
MSEVKALARLMRTLEEQLVVCMKCGMCQAVCPLFAETGLESDVARGKLALLDGLMQELFKDSKGVHERLNRCLLCGSCASNCPSGVKVLDIFIKARAILTGFRGLSPVKKIILRGMLARPDTFDRWVALGSKFQKLFIKPANDSIGTSCARFVSPLIKNRHFVPLADVPFHRMMPSLHSNTGRSGLKVAFYVGCLIDKLFPQVAQAVIDVLRYHEVGIFLPDKQGCCGIPAISSGDTKTFNRLVRHNLEVFDTQAFDYLITACATCTSTIKEIWPMMVQDEPGAIRAGVEKIAVKTLDISQFLVSAVGLTKSEKEDRKMGIDVTYHDPCHLKKSLGVFKEPRALIHANPDYRLKEMPEPDWCCGLGGSFNLQYYELSAHIGKLKRNNIRATDASVVATGCPACMLQISDMLSKSGDNIVVRHPIEIYGELIKTNGTHT